jgi:hypothetical protein
MRGRWRVWVFEDGVCDRLVDVRRTVQSAMLWCEMHMAIKISCKTVCQLAAERKDCHREAFIQQKTNRQKGSKAEENDGCGGGHTGVFKAMRCSRKGLKYRGRHCHFFFELILDNCLRKVCL